MKLISVIFVVVFCQIGICQDTGISMPKSQKKLFRRAMSASESGDIMLAHTYFQELERKGFSNQDQRFEYYKLLYKLNDYNQSQAGFQALEKEKYNNPLVSYYLCILYQHLSIPKMAKDYALFFLKNKENRKQYAPEYRQINAIKLALDTSINARDSVVARVYTIEDHVNNSAAEFNPVIIENGLLFGSQKIDKINFYRSSDIAKSKMETARKIYKSTGNKNQFQPGHLFPILTDTIEVSSFCYGHDKRVIYLSGCKYREDLHRMKCDIFVSKFKDGAWSDPILVSELNDDEGTSTHVSMGFDAVKNSYSIYFASDRAGTRGGLDLYVSTYQPRTLKFSPPRNLGARINSTQNDITPHFHNPTSTLYFSSNGRGGVGGQDVFYARLNESNFETVETLGSEINTPQDDVFFTPNKNPQTGYLVSNRYSKNSLVHPHCCDDIYYYEMTNERKLGKEGNIKIIARERRTQKLIHNIDYELYRLSSSGRTLYEEGTVPDSVILHGLPEKEEYEVRLRAPGFYKKKRVIRIEHDSLYILEFELDSIDYKPILLPLVEFEFDSFVLTVEAKEIIDSLVVPVLEENPKLKIELGAHTDSRGTDQYNEDLSEKRARAIRFYLINNKQVIPERLQSKGYGEYAPIAKNENEDGTDNAEGRQRNRRCEFRILQEEYDRY
jgi:outer membrane protein OmpA-like peptidoglycan-associated protein